MSKLFLVQSDSCCARVLAQHRRSRAALPHTPAASPRRDGGRAGELLPAGGPSRDAPAGSCEDHLAAPARLCGSFCEPRHPDAAARLPRGSELLHHPDCTPAPAGARTGPGGLPAASRGALTGICIHLYMIRHETELLLSSLFTSSCLAPVFFSRTNPHPHRSRALAEDRRGLQPRSERGTELPRHPHSSCWGPSPRPGWRPDQPGCRSRRVRGPVRRQESPRGNHACLLRGWTAFSAQHQSPLSLRLNPHLPHCFAPWGHSPDFSSCSAAAFTSL